MHSTAINRRVTPEDRFGLTLVLAVLVHAMVVLGISFAPDPGAPPRFEALEVILVAEKSAESPEDAEVLAQANLAGGGEAAADARPSTPVRAPLPAATAELAATPPPLEPRVPSVAAAQPPPAPQVRQVREDHLAVAAERAELELAERSDKAPLERAPETAQEPAPSPTPPPANAPLPTAAQLLTRSFALASVSAELQQRLDNRAKRPRMKYISANTKEFKYAAYMETWRAKVERIGNINYPEEARTRQLSGSLLLDVALRPDGSVEEITVRRSSGHAVLDDAAVRIVELAAPFAPFPPDIRRDVDVLHVTRTWKFLNSDGFSSTR